MTAYTLTIGAVVSYHGTITSEHYATFYIQSIEGGRLRIADVEYPTSGVLRGVDPAHVTPTGVVLTLCRCGHDVELITSGNCAACGCDCIDHCADH